MSPSLDWVAWLGLARLASSWLVSSAAATTTATTPEQAYKTTVAALRAAAVVVDACSGVVAVVVAKPSHAEAWLAKPSQASQSREGLTNRIGYLCDKIWVRHSTHNRLWNCGCIQSVTGSCGGPVLKGLGLDQIQHA